MFETRLVVSQVSEAEGLWEVREPLIFISEEFDFGVRVPAGFRTDFASVPRLPLVYLATGGIAQAPAVVHDYLYQRGEVSRDVADGVFLEAMAAVGVSWFRRLAMYWAVRVAGAAYYRG